MNQQPLWSSQVDNTPPLRTSSRRIFKVSLYFVGVLIAEFGLLGAALTATASDKQLQNRVGGVTLFFGLVMLMGSIFIFFRWRYHISCLHWFSYLLWILGATVGSIMALALELAFIPNPNDKTLPSVILSSIILLYGIALAWIAHLKPSLRQQVNESVRRILETTSGKQIVISDLLARLQKEYKHLGTTLNQYLGDLEYIEQVNIPGTTVTLCRMKAPKQAVAVPQVAPLPVSTLPPQIASVSLPVQVPAKKVMAPPPAQIHPTNSLRPKEAFTSLADQSTAPALPILRPNQVPALPPVQSAMPTSSQLKDMLVPLASQTVTPPTPEPNNPKPSSSLRTEQKAIKIFCCYAHTDEQLLNKLKAHLKPQQRQGLIQIWCDRDISAGTEWEQEIEEQLNTAQIILLLLSPDFMASDYCYSNEMQRALERHERGEVHAVPIILRPTDWQVTPLGKLQALPKDGKPITMWSNRDNAYLDVARGIRSVVETFLTPPQQIKQQAQIINTHQQTTAEVELIRTRCKQGQLIVTNKKILVELSAFGQDIKSQILFQSSLTSVDSKLGVAPVFGMGGGVNLTFHGKGRELLHADLVPPKEAQEIIALLS